MNQLDQLLEEIESARKHIIPQKVKKKKSFVPPATIFGVSMLLAIIGVIISDNGPEAPAESILINVINVVTIISLLSLFIVCPIYFIIVLVSRVSRAVTIDQDKFNKLNEYFKRRVNPILIQEIDPSFTYSRTGGLDLDYLYRQGLFHWKPNSGTVEDHFQGKIGETKISFCEQIIKDVSLRKKDGKTRKVVENAFKGLLIEADFNKKFNGTTLLVPDTNSRLTGKLLEFEKRGGKEQIYLENPEFENLFTVYGTDQVESRYIFSTSLMTRLTDFYKKMEPKAERKKNDLERIISSMAGDFDSKIRTFNFYILFKDNKMIMAIEWPVNYFEFDVFNSVYDEVEETKEELKAITGIVEDLNLNTRIWTK